MSSVGKLSLLIAVALLIVIGIYTADDRRSLTATSYGTTPVGFGALFELLAGLGLPVVRSFEPPDALPAEATVWWIQPHGLCETAAHAERDEENDRGLSPAPWRGYPWIAGGGTAVVFLPWYDEEKHECQRIAGVAVPKRNPVEEEDETEAEDDSDDEDEWAEATPEAFEQVMQGELIPEFRVLATWALRFFLQDANRLEMEGWSVRAHIDEAPFVIEREVGEGRIVLVADSLFLTNRFLDRDDSAPLAIDLVRSYGIPMIDERSHGFRRHGATAYIVRSPALAVFIGLALIGLAVWWREGSVPPRKVQEYDPTAPTLEHYVTSLSSLYARSEDFLHIFEAYRELTADRLRRHFGLAPETPIRQLVSRLSRDRRLPRESIQLLEHSQPITRAQDFRRAVKSLDQLVEEATR